MISRILGAIIVSCISLTLSAQVVINEYSASNLNDHQDNFGEYEDWIEVYNAGATATSISGYKLSDNLANPNKFTFPPTVLQPGESTIVYASARSGFIQGANHASFKLTQSTQEKIIFSDNTGNIIDSLTLIPTQTNHSRGRITDGDPTWGVFTNPSPDASNSNSNSHYAVTPEFSIQAGFYPNTQNVTITTTEPNSLIYYTVDGAAPSTGSNGYVGPIPVSTNTVIRAIAVSSDPNVLESFIATNTYFIGTTHTVPVISVASEDLMSLMNGNQNEPVGSFEYFESDGSFKDEAVGDFNKHGNDSWAYDQRGFDYVTRDQYGYNNTIKHKIFETKNRDKFQRLIIKAAANDNYNFEDGAHIRDSYVHHLSQLADLRMDERSWAPAILYVNGQYWGVYDTREKVDDPDFTRRYYDQPEYDLDFIKTWGNTWAEYGSRDDWDTLHAFIVNEDMSIQANYDAVKAVFNTGSLIDYILLNTHVVCADWLNWNTAWWRGRNPLGDKKKWRYALWDMDATFGHYINYTGVPSTQPVADPCDNTSPSIDDPEGHTEMLEALYDNDEFFSDYITRYAYLNSTYFSCDSMHAILDRMIATIEPEMPGQIARWGGSIADWQTKVVDLKDFIDTRCAIIDQGIVDCYPVTGPHDLTVDVDPPGGGDVEVNGTAGPAYPFTAQYFSGVVLEVDAVSPFQFLFWTINGDTLLPNLNVPNVTLTLDQAATVVAHYDTTVVGIFTEEISLFDFKAYPTVTDGMLILEFELPEHTTVDADLISVDGRYNGKLIERKDLAAGAHQLQFNLDEMQLANGMYIVNLSTPIGNEQVKLIYTD